MKTIGIQRNLTKGSNSYYSLLAWMLKFQLENYETLQENTDNRTVHGSWPLRTLKPLKKQQILNGKFEKISIPG